MLFLKKGNLKNSTMLSGVFSFFFFMASKTLIPVPGPLIQEEALKIPLRLCVVEFVASNRWLEKWKNRHNFK